MPTKNRQQLLIIAAAAIVGLFLLDQFVIEPLRDIWKKRDERIVQLKQDFKDGQALVARERGIRNHWRDISTRTLTNNTSSAEQRVLQAIDRWAQSSGAVVAGVNRQWKKDADDYMTFECRVDVTGDLRRVNQFLYSVEKEPMALRLQSVELSARDKEGRQLALALQFSGLILTPQKR